jgi:hypothetical protein
VGSKARTSDGREPFPTRARTHTHTHTHTHTSYPNAVGVGLIVTTPHIQHTTGFRYGASMVEAYRRSHRFTLPATTLCHTHISISPTPISVSPTAMRTATFPSTVPTISLAIPPTSSTSTLTTTITTTITECTVCVWLVAHTPPAERGTVEEEHAVEILQSSAAPEHDRLVAEQVHAVAVERRRGITGGERGGPAHAAEAEQVCVVLALAIVASEQQQSVLPLHALVRQSPTGCDPVKTGL